MPVAAPGDARTASPWAASVLSQKFVEQWSGRKRATEFSYEFLTQRTSTAGELAQILRREILKWRNGVAGAGIKVH